MIVLILTPKDKPSGWQSLEEGRFIVFSVFKTRFLVVTSNTTLKDQANADAELALTIISSHLEDAQRIDVARYLVQVKGVNPAQPTTRFGNPQYDCCINEGDTPLHLAAKRADREMCELLLALGAPINARNARRETPLISAILASEDAYDERFVTWLLQQPGAYDPASATFEYDPNIAAFMGITTGAAHPLHDLVSRQFLEPARLMLEAGSPAGDNSMRGNSPLVIAVEKNDAQMVSLLCQHGFHPDEFDPEGLTPVHHACMCGAGDALHALIKAGADMNLRSRAKTKAQSGIRPLKVAISHNYPHVVRALLKAGALHTELDNENSSAIEAAIRHGASGKVLQELYAARYREAIADNRQHHLNEWIRLSVVSDNLSATEWLVDQGADTSARHGGRTLLQMAKRQGIQIKRLLRSVNLRNRIADAFEDEPIDHVSRATISTVL